MLKPMRTTAANPLLDPNFWPTATPESVRAAVQGGAEVNAKSNGDNTPLHIAALYNASPEIVRTLVTLGAEVNAKNHKSATPLHIAACTSELSEAVLALLELGADHRATTDSGVLAWDLIRDNKALKNTPARQALERLQDVQPPA
jgi:ankyrin repeat protein